MEFSVLQVLEGQIHSESGVKPIEFVVERFSWLDALNLHWLGVID